MSDGAAERPLRAWIVGGERAWADEMRLSSIARLLDPRAPVDEALPAGAPPSPALAPPHSPITAL